jgi:hypothetical protein
MSNHDEDPSEWKEPESWSEADVPLEYRGVNRLWLIAYLRNLLDEINAPRLKAIEEAEAAKDNNSAGWLYGAPHQPVPDIPPYSFLNTHGLVRLIKRMTAPIRAPVYALLPEAVRGRPTTFVSHTWNSLLFGPDQQRIGTLDALEASDAEFVWIDFVSYNQHIFEPKTIPIDMLRVIQTIGSITVCATPTPIYNRCWCLWELFCAHRAGVEISLLIAGRHYRNDKILAVNALYRSFKGVELAEASVPGDREMIINECISYFGSIGHANSELERFIRESFSGEMYELQDKNGPLKFSPTPWIASTGKVINPSPSLLGSDVVEPAAFAPYYTPGLLDSDVYGTYQSVLGLFVMSGVYLDEKDTQRWYETVLRRMKGEIEG